MHEESVPGLERRSTDQNNARLRAQIPSGRRGCPISKVVLPEVRDICKAAACVEISHENIPVAISFRFVVVTIVIPTFLLRPLTTSRHRFIVFIDIFALDCEQFLVLW